MKALFIIGLGGAIGSMLRLLLIEALPKVIMGNFPLQIFVVNILGCFVMGILTEGMAMHFSLPNMVRSFLTTGLLGGFTTFSSFSLEFGLLVERKLISLAIFYACISVTLSLMAYFIGMYLVRSFR